MTKTVLITSGKISDIVNHLKTLQQIFGKGATLSDVATVARYAAIIQTEKNFFRGVKNGNKNN